ncbi:GNAT family N-acetyltransferase [Pseudomonas marginalis]|uniref:GNAT family N-acetyltransferase n=1 Tax=Pseudomonas marginalis TaxID=298 RepID=A0A9X9BQK5_PSEMA|nr:GNAT family N-acetyltransferase [Pseudomonas marginalis]TWR54692.1 GNAT family N-acetyltransferase [Pseudomonas marginalis]SEB46220.1 hypothetical protein SAMN04490193_1368 [Pseudomonas marginalis]
MSANAASVLPGDEPGAALSPLIKGGAQGQCHRIPVQAQFDGYSVPALLTVQGEAHCLLELPAGTYRAGAAPVSVALYFQQNLHHPVVPVKMRGRWAPSQQPCLELVNSGPRPAHLNERERCEEPLKALARSPVLFNRRLSLDLHYLSPLKGVFEVMDRDVVIVSGMDLELQFNCPWSGLAIARVQVLGRFEEHGRWLCHFRVLDTPSSRAVALMLLCRQRHFTFDSLPAALRKGAAVDRLINVAIIQNADALEEVLACRLAANRHYGRLEDVQDPHTLWDEWDPYAIQVCARLGNKCVGSGRVVVNSSHRERCEIEVSTPLPVWLWDAGFVEMSRVAVLPEYAGHRVMLALLRELGRVALHLRSRYIVLDAIEILVPVYTRLGAQCLPITKKHPYSGESVRVMYFDVGQLLSRLNWHLPQWLYVFGPTIEHSVHRRQIGALAAQFRVSSMGIRVKWGIARALKKLRG